MKPRWLVALLLITMPIWFIPILIYIGWVEEGRDIIKEIPQVLRYILFGERGDE